MTKSQEIIHLLVGASYASAIMFGVAWFDSQQFWDAFLGLISTSLFALSATCLMWMYRSNRIETSNG